jgi:carbon-monoxide dehydrogenase medium subunit
MKPAPFVYHAPRTLDEALSTLSIVAAEDGRVLAGGQSLVPTMAFRLARPGHLVDINGIEEISRLAVQDGAISIGAGVRHAAFHTPVVAGPLGPLLTFVARHVAHYPIRVRGTFCGSLAHADPASEWCLLAVTLGAEITAAKVGATRVVMADAFFQGIMTTSLAEDEILTQAQLRLPPADTRFGFYEFSRRAGDYALAAALTSFRLVEGVIVEPRLGIGGAEACPRRLGEAERLLDGSAPSGTLFRAAAEAAADCVDPLEDIQADAAYRRDLVRAVTQRALERAAK